MKTTKFFQTITVLLLLLFLSFETTATLRINVASNGFLFYKDGKNIYDHNKKLIISESRGYDYVMFVPSIIYGGFFKITKNGQYGLCDLSGKEIIKPKYRFIYQYKDNPYFNVEKGILNIDGKEFKEGVHFSIADGFYYYDSKYKMKIAGKLNRNEHYRLKDLGKKILRETRRKPEARQKTQTVMINNKKQNKEEQKGFIWIKINNNGCLGVADANGQVIIPAEYEDVEFMQLTDDMSCFKCINSNGGPNIFTLTGSPIISEEFYGSIKFIKNKDIIGYFIFKKFFNDGKVGTAAYDLSGNRIVSTLCCYSDVRFCSELGCIGYFKVFDGQKEGAVDIYGNTIIKPKKKEMLLYSSKNGFFYRKDKYYMGIKLRSDGTADDSKKRQWDREKSQRRAQMWANIIQAAAIGTQQTLAMMQSQSMQKSTGYKPSYGKVGGSLADQMETPGYFNNAFNQLMNLSAFQVQQQEMADYNMMRQAYLSMGKDLSYQEYCMLKGQAIENLKEQGYDIIAEQKKINEDLHNFNRSMMNSGKENVERIKQQNDLKSGKSTYSDTSNTTSSNKTTNSYSTTNNTNTTSRTSSSTSYGSTDGGTSSSGTTSNNDAHEQFKTGNINTDSSSYGDKIKNVSMAVKDGASFRSVNLHGELYKKNGQYYVKIGNSFFKVNNTGGTYNGYIIYGAKAHYFNK